MSLENEAIDLIKDDKRRRGIEEVARIMKQRQALNDQFVHSLNRMNDRIHELEAGAEPACDYEDCGRVEIGPRCAR